VSGPAEEWPPPRGSVASRVVSAVMIVVGILLLLPGACALYFLAAEIVSGNLVRLVTRDPYFQAVLFVWVVSVLSALGGAALIWLGVRRDRMRTS
jgi:hypothetical protein